MKLFLVFLLAAAAVVNSSPIKKEISENEYVSVLLEGEESDIPKDMLGVGVNIINEDGTIVSDRILPKDEVAAEVEEQIAAVPLPEIVPSPDALPAVPEPAPLPEILPMPAPGIAVPIPEIIPQGPAIAIPLPGIIEPAPLLPEIQILPMPFPQGPAVAVPLPGIIEPAPLAPEVGILPMPFPQGPAIAVPLPGIINPAPGLPDVGPVPLPPVMKPEEVPVVPAVPESEPVAEVPKEEKPLTGEIYKDDLVSVVVNAPEDEGVMAKLRSWFSMIINSFSGGEVKSEKIL